jgi:DUF438 domain-containing protein
MSEMINNREYRQKVLKELIGELHSGKSVEEVKPRFEKLIQGISTKEIAEMEQALIMEGMPVEEIQNLCDVHAAVFKGSIEEIHRPEKPEENPGHPVHTFLMENRKIEKLIKNNLMNHLNEWKSTSNKEARNSLLEDIKTLLQIDKHYSRKENLLFPYMEKYGITAPPKVMWGVDDEIRDLIKEIRGLLENGNTELKVIEDKINEAVDRVNEMIYKEENILFPMVLETLSEDEWVDIMDASEEIGYTLYVPKIKWKPVSKDSDRLLKDTNNETPTKAGFVQFDAGMMSYEETNAMLNTLPLDITFVDKDGIVKYFTQGKERIFPRPKTVIGREVKNCHPPASVHIVEQIVEDLKSGKKEHEDFWIQMHGKYVYIRYYAVRNEKGEFLGVMELTQDIKPIQEITGEKRLVTED